MSVTHKQIDQIYIIMQKYLTETQLRSMLVDLMATDAFESNKSFRETINRLFDNSMIIIK
jgi:hypothetical protein